MVGRTSRSHGWLVVWELIPLLWLIVALNRLSNADGLFTSADDISPMAWSLLVGSGQAVALAVASGVIGFLPAAWSSIARNQRDGGPVPPVVQPQQSSAGVAQD